MFKIRDVAPGGIPLFLLVSLCLAAPGCQGQVGVLDAAQWDNGGQDGPGAKLDASHKEAGSPPRDGPQKDKGSGPAPDTGKPQPVNCSAIAKQSGWTLCGSTATTCSAVFTDGAGCIKLCKAAGLSCLEVWENIDGQCKADKSKAKLSCSPASGHTSDFCVCGGKSGPCVPKTCASAMLQCGGNHPDGCGGTFSCAGSCPTGMACVQGYCGAPQPMIRRQNCAAVIQVKV